MLENIAYSCRYNFNFKAFVDFETSLRSNLFVRNCYLHLKISQKFWLQINRANFDFIKFIRLVHFKSHSKIIYLIYS